MKKIIKALKITSTLLFITVAFIACDKDFTTIESDIQGSQNFNTSSIKFPVTAYNKKLDPLQTDQLSSNLLGVYKDAIYGLTTAQVVTQVSLASYEPDFGYLPIIDSVRVTIPYFVTIDGTNDEGNILYDIDSLFGESKIKLSIYENKYFLRDYNPENIEEDQEYFSNANSTINFDNHVGPILFETDNAGFTPDNSEIVLNADTDDEEKLPASLRLSLDNTADFWKTKLFDKQGGFELNNANNFREYFRGLYFKTEAMLDSDNMLNGNMLMLDFAKGNITIYYTNITNGEDDGEREEKTFELTFSGNRINIFENDPTNAIIADADAAANTIDGDENLFIKGGEGGMAIVNLFEGTINVEGVDYDSYDYFKNKKDSWLLNEAYLTFYVDQESGVNTSQEPYRVMLYDVKNNTPLVDYFFDFTDAANPENSKIFHSTPLIKDSDENGEKYKIRLTEHVNNIFLKDSTNLELGLLVTSNINEILSNSILNSDNTIISGAIMSPKGTILHGSNENVPEAERLQLEIFYTEPEN